MAWGNGVAIASNNNDVGDAAILKERVTMLEKLLEEKERTIQILVKEM